SLRRRPRWSCIGAIMEEAQAPASRIPGRPEFGEGSEEMPDGSVYTGSFRFSQREGHGVLLLNAEGTERYEGSFLRGHFDGHGIRKMADGSVYEGQWRAGRKHGEGELRETCVPSRAYSGQWKDGKRHGFGVQQMDSHTRYEGRWENGMQHGSGRFIDARNETVFQGHWVCGAHHGNAVLRSKGGAREKLRYNHGMLVSVEEIPRPQVRLPVSKAAHAV
ncbi:unnamed protein product, partial [Effrenium voratum]